MYRLPRCTIIVVTVLLALAISAMWTVPVFADDEIPPPPETSEPAPPIEEGSGGEVVPAETPPEETPVDEAAPVESPAEDAPVDESVSEAPPAEEPIVEETPPVETVPSESPILEQLPEGTELVVVGTDGEAIPLATLDAADAVEFRDPIWCPTGVAPDPLNPACSDDEASLSALIASGSPLTGGVIWIQWGADTGGNALIDGAGSWASGAAFSLTLQGGWEGTYGSTALHAADPYSYFDTTISIQNWIGAVTIKNIVIDGAGGAGYALDVETQGNITLTDVDVTNNTTALGGASLNNTSGAGNVTLTNSEFSGNTDGTGLEVDSKGTISLTNVKANNNGIRGASLDNSTAPTAKNVTLITGANEFNYNGENGIEIFSKGAIMLKDIDVIGNGCLDPGPPANCYNGGWFDNTAGTAPITMTGTNVFSENQGGGIAVFSHGAVTINNFIAIANPGGSGAYIDNATGTATAQPVTFTGFVQAKMNARGLRILSNGAVTLNNVTANNNGSNGPESGGVFITNNNAFASPVSVLGTNNFNDNGMTGLTVYSNGAVTLNNITSFGNGFYDPDGDIRDPLNTDPAFDDQYYGYGVFVDNTSATLPQNVTLTGANFFGWNALSGLEVYTQGSIAGSNLSAYSNGWYDQANDLDGPDTVYGYGAYLDNCGFDWTLDECLSTGPAKPITLTGTNNFGSNWSAGVWVFSYGAITINNLTAHESGGPGAYLYNLEANPLVPQNVTLTGSVNLLSNGYSGMNIWSLGAISLSNVTANDNGRNGPPGGGVYLDNSMGSIPKPITVSGSNNFQSNLTYGLRINSKGAVTLNNIASSNNGLEGLSVDNSFPGAVGGITLNGSSGIYENGDTGVSFWSRGLIKINNLDSGNNYGYGAYLDNQLGSAVGVTLTGKNYFWGNWLSGLEVYSKGAVSLANVDTGNNGWDNGTDPRYGYGVYVDNSGAATPQAVTMTGWNNFDGNFTGGLYIFSKGAITLSQLNAINTVNGAGVVLENRSNPLLPQNVTLSGFGDFHWNWDTGLVVFTHGMITLNNVRASNNGGEGVYLNNWWGSIPKAVTLNGTNEFYNNGADGLDILSLGAITVRLRESSGNFGNGVVLDNGTMAGSVGGVTLIGKDCDPWGTGPMYGCIQGNGGDGLDITSRGAITLTMVLVRGNTGHGARIDNASGTGGVTFTITGGEDPANRFYGNGDYGIWVTTNGAIVAAELRANDNAAFGALLNNSTGTSPVTLTGVWVAFNRNHGGTGLEILSRGAVTLNNLIANDNGYYDAGSDTYFGYGVYVDNLGASTPQNVTINGTNTFNNNLLSGLEVYSKGIITASNLTANWNGHFDPVNDITGTPNWNTVYGYGAKLVNTGGLAAVTLTGVNYFESNWNSGLHVESKGNISVSSLTSKWNGQEDGTFNDDGDPWNSNDAYGAYLDNWWGGATGNVTLTGYAYMEGNIENGLVIYSMGTVTLANLTSNNNWAEGVHIDNSASATAPKNVTITGTNQFDGNGSNGLSVYSYGALALNNLTARWNGQSGYGGGAGGDGVILDNCIWSDVLLVCTALTPKNITLTGVNTFYANHNNGLFFDASGSAMLNNVTADSNNNDSVNPSTGHGVFGFAVSNITIACGSMNGNGNPAATEAYGYKLLAGSITLKGVFAFGNWNGNFTNPVPVIIRNCP